MFIVDEKTGSKYRYIVLCTQRTKQLLQGADPRVAGPEKNPAYLAMQEMSQGKIEWKFKSSEEKKEEEAETVEDVPAEENS